MLVEKFRAKLIDIVSPYMTSDGSHDIQHLHRVWHNACSIIKHDNLEVDLITICASVYLHDIKQYKKDDPNNYKSSTVAAEFAREILSENFEQLSEEQFAIIKNCIEAHSFSANIKATCLEAKIVQDADRLDSLGAIGIARLFYTAGALNKFLYCPYPHALDDKEFAIDHFYKKLIKLPSLMLTKSGRILAQDRVHFVDLYLKQFIKEADLELSSLYDTSEL